MNINNAIIKHYLKNVLFITGTAYAGKSTMAAMLAEKYDLIFCGENYHADTEAIKLATPEQYPNICYFQTMRDWQEFVNRTPEAYARWIDGVSREVAEFEIAELMHISSSKKVIVDTNIPIDVLMQIAEYRQVAVMLSPQSMSVDRFFDRGDADKQFILAQIQSAQDPDRTMRNFRKCLEAIHSKENYDALANSGFFTLMREDAERDTRKETLAALAKHFALA